MQSFARVALPIARRTFAAQSKFTLCAFRGVATTRFAKTHEYVTLDGDIGTVGITKHAADALGDIVYVSLPEVGSKYAAGESFGAVESVKAASDVYSPVEGQVLEINKGLDESPGKVNDSPLKEGWFIKIKVSKKGQTEFKALLDDKAYKLHVDSEKH